MSAAVRYSEELLAVFGNVVHETVDGMWKIYPAAKPQLYKLFDKHGKEICLL